MCVAQYLAKKEYNRHSLRGDLMKYKVIKRVNPQDREGQPKYYASPVYSGELTINELSKSLSEACTINIVDVKAVLEAFTERLPWYLQNGFIIQLGAMGRFRLSISAQGKTTADDVSSEDVTNTRILFVPSVEIKHELEKTTFEKA